MKEKYDIDYKAAGFYHTFYLSDSKRSVELWDFNEDDNDVIVVGQWNHNPIAKDILEVLNFSNKSVLDIGCNDGFYSYLCEKNKNTVTGVDFYNGESRKFIHEYLKSKVVFIHDNVNNFLKWNKSYQVGILGDILLHLENPLGVLKLVRNIITEKLIIVFDYIDTDYPYIRTNDVEHTPYVFSIGSMIHFLKISGFTNFKVEKKLMIKSESKKYNWDDRNICVLTADINPLYEFNKLHSSYYGIVI